MVKIGQPALHSIMEAATYKDGQKRAQLQSIANSRRAVLSGAASPTSKKTRWFCFGQARCTVECGTRDRHHTGSKASPCLASCARHADSSDAKMLCDTRRPTPVCNSRYRGTLPCLYLTYVAHCRSTSTKKAAPQFPYFSFFPKGGEVDASASQEPTGHWPKLSYRHQWAVGEAVVNRSCPFCPSCPCSCLDLFSRPCSSPSLLHLLCTTLKAHHRHQSTSSRVLNCCIVHLGACRQLHPNSPLLLVHPPVAFSHQ